MSAKILDLRDYQRDTIRKLHMSWDAGHTRVPAVLATGLGKTVIFAHLIMEWLKANPGKRALVLAHTDELVLQAAKKLQQVAPDIPVGVVKAERNETMARVIVASVQTLRGERRRSQLRRIGLIVVDECHHAVATTYRTILEHFGAFEAPARCVVAGFTATLARGDKLKLSEVWETVTADLSIKYGISFGIRRGYLLDVRGKRVVIPEMDLGNVKKSGGDYAEGSLAAELDRALAPQKVAEAYAEHAADRKGICFVPTVEVAYHFAEAFTAEGIPANVIHGGLGQLERRLILKQLAEGDLQVVVNCAVLTEGFDDPTISCVVIARPTRSAPLYQQMVGRGLRPNLALAPGDRGDCLVLDVVGASRAHDLRSLVDLSEREIRPELEDEDLSLLEMEEFQDQEEQNARDEKPEVDPYAGDIATEDFDPLGRTTAGAWLQTFDGHYFLPAGRAAYVLLAPGEEPNTYDVAWLAKRGTDGGFTEHRGLPLEIAISWAEEVMEEHGGEGAGILSSGRKRWRKDAPSEKQKAWCRANGVPLDGMNKGNIADAMSIVDASRKIDPVVRSLLAGRG